MANKQQYFEGVFQDSTLSKDPNQLYTFVEGQDNYFLQKSLGITATIISSDIELLRDNIFPSSASSTYLDKHLASLNLPIRSGATVSLGTMQFGTPVLPTPAPPGPTPVAPYYLVNPLTLTLGTTLSNNTSGNVYLIQNNVTFTNPVVTPPAPIDISTITFDFISQQVGSSTYSIVGTPNTFGTPISILVSDSSTPAIQLTVTINSANIISIASGIDGQTDYDISDIINRNFRFPKGSGSIGDFYNWALQSSPNIQDVIIVSNGFINSNVNTWIYVAPMTGSKDPNININLPYPINRGVNDTTIGICNQYIETKRGILDNVNVVNVSTYLIQNFNSTTNPNTSSPKTPTGITITLNINLSLGISKDTYITGTNGINQTVDLWIRQQFRYAILSAPYQGETVDNTSNVYIKNDTIITILKSRLGNDSISTGILASIIEYASFTYIDDTILSRTPIPNIPVPNFSNLFIPAIQPTSTTPLILASIAGIYDIDNTIATLTINYPIYP